MRVRTGLIVGDLAAMVREQRLLCLDGKSRAGQCPGSLGRVGVVTPISNMPKAGSSWVRRSFMFPQHVGDLTVFEF